MAMDFLRKAPEIEWRTFLMILFLAAYGATVVTVLGMYGYLEAVGLLIGVLLLTALTLMTLAFGFSRLVRRTDTIDLMWPIVIIVVAVASLVASQHEVELGYNVQTLATGLVVVWGVRLGYHIVRRLLTRGEDVRYKELRKKWRKNEAVNVYVKIFTVQAVLAVVVAAAVICINSGEAMAPGAWAWIGAVVWLGGFLVESVSDWQLRRFLSRTKRVNALMTEGLWRYSRHPNYFGEAVQWWGISIIALSFPFGWMGVVSPVMITYLLLFVSGVPLAERHAAKKRGWKAYAKHTSAFVPRLPTAR